MYSQFIMYAPINENLPYLRHKYEYQPGPEASPVWYLCIHTMPVSSASGICSSPCTLSLMIICRTKCINTNTNLCLKHLQSGICVFIQRQCRLHQVYAVHHVETNKCPIYIKDEKTDLGLKHLKSGICVFI